MPSIDGKEILTHKYFNVDDKGIRKSHQWKRSNYPKCEGYINNSIKAEIKKYIVELNKKNGISEVDNFNDFYNEVRNAIRQNKKKMALRIEQYNKDLYDPEKIVNSVIENSKNYNFLKILIYPSRYLRRRCYRILEIIFEDME